MYHYKETPGAIAPGVLLFQNLHEIAHVQIQNAADIDSQRKVDLAVSRFNMSVVRPAYTEFLCNVGLKEAFHLTIRACTGGVKPSFWGNQSFNECNATRMSVPCNLGTAFELSFALDAAIHHNDPRYARTLYYEGRVHDGLPFLEKYRVYEAGKDYLAQIKVDRKERVSQLLDLFPDFRMRLKFNPRYRKVEYGADVHSVFDICWYTFARMIADTAPPVDYGAEDMFAQGSVLSCMACGNYFVRRSSRQRYCQRPECQAERNRKNRRASYARRNRR